MPLRHRDTNLPAGKAGIHKEKNMGVLTLVNPSASETLWLEIGLSNNNMK